MIDWKKTLNRSYKSKSFILALAGSLSLGCLAHEEAIESGWCSEGEIHILGTFSLNQRLLEKFRDETDPVCNQYQRSCGQFDDDYGLSYRAAGSICHSFSSDELAYRNDGDHKTVRPIFHSPVTMKNAESNHHEIYTIDQGVEFSCGYCVIPEVETATRSESDKDATVTRN